MSIDAEKVFDKNPVPIYDKNSQQSRKRGQISRNQLYFYTPVMNSQSGNRGNILQYIGLAKKFICFFL